MPAIAERIFANAPPRFALVCLGAVTSPSRYCALRPSASQSSALLDTSARPDTVEQSAAREKFISMAQAGRLGEVAETLARRFYIATARKIPRSEYWCANGIRHGRGCIRASAKGDHVAAGFPFVVCRYSTVVIVGDGDDVTPQTSREICGGIPDARLVVVPDCGHLSTVEQPKVVNAALAVAWTLIGTHGNYASLSGLHPFATAGPDAYTSSLSAKDTMMRTQVGIVGAGPAGLMLARLLHLQGVESVIIENRSRNYIENRIRAGLIEHWAADLLSDLGVGERMQQEGMLHWGINIGINGDLHRIDFKALVDKRVTIYGQQEVVKDLVERRLADGGALLFDVSDVSIHDLTGKQPKIRFSHDGRQQEISCDFIAGCDGFHGICRPSIPDGVLSVFERDYPFGWLGILSESPPPDHELVYSYTDRGFALYTMRSPTLARLYLQCDHDEEIENWPDNRIWDELHKRLGGARKLQEGKMLQKGVTPMRSFVVEPMQYGRLFLAGDSAHIVPPTGAKGMNLAFADVMMLSRAVSAFYEKQRSDLLEAYSATCLGRVWKAQRFSWWMTQIMHRFPHETAFDRRRQLSDLDYLTGSKAAATSLAEQYVGLPLD